MKQIAITLKTLYDGTLCDNNIAVTHSVPAGSYGIVTNINSNTAYFTTTQHVYTVESEDETIFNDIVDENYSFIVNVNELQFVNPTIEINPVYEYDYTNTTYDI